MKLIDLLEEQEQDEYGQVTFLGSQLEGIKDQLLLTDEFKYVKNIVILDMPVFTYAPTFTEQPKSYSTITRKLNQDDIFLDTLYLYGLYTTPEMCYPNMLDKLEYGKDYITPTTYNPMDFEPCKRMILEFNPTESQHMIKVKLLDKVMNMMEKPEKYHIKGTRGIMVRYAADLSTIYNKNDK